MSDDPQKPERNAADEAVRKASRGRTRRSFAVGAAAAGAGYGFYRWINHSPMINGQPAPLHRMFGINADLGRALGEEHILSPTYSPERAQQLRVNGAVGLDQDIVLASWRLQMAGVRDASRHPRYVSDLTTYEYKYVDSGTPQPLQQTSPPSDRKSNPANAKSAPAADPGTGQPPLQPPAPDAGESVSISVRVNPAAGASNSIADRFNNMARQIAHRRVRGDDSVGPSDSGLYDGTPGLLLTMADVDRLPRTELVTQFKCIEGWSQIVQWSGFRLRDLIEAYPPAPKADGSLPRYVYMETPDGFYYNGYDFKACLHPQTLLVTHMGGQPLTQEHGAPLRLHMPIKYGYKQIKRIGLIAYTDLQPDDYWAKVGYDWFGGL